MACTTTSFSASTTGIEVASAFRECIQGKNILITGVSPNSLGESAALSFASVIAETTKYDTSRGILILASRTPAKLASVASRLKERYPTVTVATVILDLSNYGSVREGAGCILQILDKAGRGGRLHILINNAGVSLTRRATNSHGVEMTFATNHLGPFLLTKLLMPALLGAADEMSQNKGSVRVVNVSSSGHFVCPVRFSDYNFIKGQNDVPADERPRLKGSPRFVAEEDGAGFPGVLAYGQSKTANILFTIGLNKRFGDRGILSFAVDPGLINTGLVRDISPAFAKQLENTPQELWKSADQGCATELVAALDPSLSDSNAVYLSGCHLSRPASFAVDEEKADRLWELSEKLVIEETLNGKL